MTSTKINPDEAENVARLYWQEEMAYAQIAAVYGVSRITVKNFMVKHDIPRRDRSAANSLMRNRSEVVEKRRATYSSKEIPSSTKRKQWTLKKRRYNLNSRGENNSNWKGGKTKTSLLIRAMPEYATWRAEVFRRDNYACVKCGDRTCAGNKVVIHADHIDPVSQIIDEYKIVDTATALTCQKLWDTNNGRTLCKKCHEQTDTYGKNFVKNSK